MTAMRLLCCFSLLLLAACTSRAPNVINPYLPNLVDGRPAIIFVHGYYGAALRQPHLGKRVFYSVREAMFGKSAMSLYQGRLGTPKGSDLEVEGLLASVPVVPALYEVDVYSTFIRDLREFSKGSQVLPLVYDWREDLTAPVHQLDELVKLLLERGCKKISIIAHSMGGLPVTYYLGYGNQPPETAKLSWEGAKHVQRVAFFGVPFRGSMIAFRSFEKGSGLPMSSTLLNADTMSSFPSLYQLIPNLTTVRDPKGEAFALPLFEPATWKKYKFGLLGLPGLPPELLAAREKFTEEQLARAKRWSELVQLGSSAAWPSPPSLKVLNVVGGTKETLDQAYLYADSGKILFDPDDVKEAGLKMEPLYSMGDGSVSRVSADVPPALEAATKVVSTEYPHEKLFLDPLVETEYKEFLRDFNKDSRED